MRRPQRAANWPVRRMTTREVSQVDGKTRPRMSQWLWQAWQQIPPRAGHGATLTVHGQRLSLAGGGMAMVIVGIALVGALIVAGILALVRYTITVAQRRSIAPAELGRWVAGIFIGNFVLDLAILYFVQPALTGPPNGWEWWLSPLFLTRLVVLFTSGWSGSRVLIDMLEQIAGRGTLRVAPGAGGPRRVVNAGDRTGGAGGAGRLLPSWVGSLPPGPVLQLPHG